MELRILKYFLMVAREENITRAASLLHVTQPTISRQLMQLEEELGVTLFKRSRSKIILTDDGMLLKHRAQEIVELTEKMEREFSRGESELSGEVMIGCAETRNMSFLSQSIAKFRKKHPLVRFRIWSANADDTKERIEKGLLDMGLIIEPVDIGKYEFMRMVQKEPWGVLVRKDSPLAQLKTVSPQDLVGYPLIVGMREQIVQSIASWFGDYYKDIEIVASFNLSLNAIDMMKNGVGITLGIDLVKDDDITFIPLSPPIEVGTVIAWKKNQVFSKSAERFIEFLRDTLQA